MASSPMDAAILKSEDLGKKYHVPRFNIEIR